MEGAAQALKEHYGISLSASVINKVTQETGLAAKVFNAEVAAPSKSADLIVVQIDGSMVPIVEYGEASAEQKAEGMKRKRECFWKEFRLCTASRLGEEKTRYGLTDGSPFEAGCMMYPTAKAEGMGEQTRIHGVGDGAPWIEEQFEEQFGANHSFLIDFYHVGEYLAAAAKEAGDETGKAGKYREWKEKMLADKVEEVIAELGALHQKHPQKEAVEASHRYLCNRTAHLRYAKALAEDLPIGSRVKWKAATAACYRSG
jgi:hypothetical protein